MPAAILFVLTIIGIGISYYCAFDTTIWWLEASPVLVGLVALVATRNYYDFTHFTYGFIFLSFVLLLIGAHYTYCHVPLFDRLRDAYQLSRNHYDRLGHFFQGVIPAFVLREVLLGKHIARKSVWLNMVVIFACLGFSALYEIIEMIVSCFFKGDTIDWFLGMQGDAWDTQKDMLMAFLGALTAMCLFSRLQDKAIAKKVGI